MRIMTPAAEAKARSKAAAALRTPVGYAKGVLGHSVWGMQATIMNEIAARRRVAVKSCHASGKTFISADIAMWWITTYPDAIAVTTAPTWTQVEKLLWGEIRNNVGSPNCKVKYPNITSTELKISEKNYAIGISTNNSARFQGFHSRKVLIILDEAPGVRPEVWEAINGLRAGGEVKLLAIGNPVIVGGDFYDIFTSKRGLWTTHTISAFDTPNLRHLFLEFTDDHGEVVKVGCGKDLMELSEEDLDRNERPYLCTRRWVKEMYEEWGPGHPYFQSRVLGDFPTESDDALLPLSWLEKLKISNPKAAPDEEITAGLDVAGPGEAETVLCVQRGDEIILLKAWPHADPRGEIVNALGPYKADLARLNVDSAGMGWGMYLHLADIFDQKTVNGGKKKIVYPINVGEAARDKKKFVNSKAEYYWGLRMKVRAGELGGLTDEKAIGQMAVIKYKHNSRGLIEIESKQDMIKRGIKSPDRAEAIMLCNAVSKRSLRSGFALDVGGGADAGDDSGIMRSSGWRGGGSSASRWNNDE